MKRIVSLSLVLLMILTLAGCGKAETGDVQEENIDYTTGTPWLDIDLDGVVTKDTPADLQL